MAHLVPDREPATGKRVLGAPFDHELAGASTGPYLGRYREPRDVPDVRDSRERCEEIDVDGQTLESPESLDLVK
jgi:hypothetical protein